MYVSPQKASFKKSMRGYKARQVDAYIETLCSEFAGAEEDYQTKILSLEKEIVMLREQLAQYEALKQEYDALLAEKKRFQKRRFRLSRKNDASAESRVDHGEPQAELSDMASSKQMNAPIAEHKEDRLRRFFSVSANVVRLVGHTGKRVGKLLSALPEPSAGREKQTSSTSHLSSEKQKDMKKQHLREKKAQKKLERSAKKNSKKKQV
jgi:DivIVA domain-containing protein